MKNFRIFLLCGLAVLLAGVAQLVGGGRGGLVFGIPLVILGIICVIASVASRSRSPR